MKTLDTEMREVLAKFDDFLKEDGVDTFVNDTEIAAIEDFPLRDLLFLAYMRGAKAALAVLQDREAAKAKSDAVH